MATISQLKLPNNDVYDIKDAVMRSYVSASGNANCTNAILYGTVDSTSTATVYTATVEGLDKLVDGTCVMLHNGVVTSASGFTVNINGLGAKKCYNNMTNATQDTTIFNASYTMLFVYSTALDSGSGGWWIYRGDVSMTEEEVDAAVYAAWPSYAITNNASAYATVGKTSATEGETVSVTVTSVNATHEVRAYFGTFKTTLGSWDSVGTYTFVMPAADVTIAYEFRGGGNN